MSIFITSQIESFWNTTFCYSISGRQDFVIGNYTVCESQLTVCSEKVHYNVIISSKIFRCFKTHTRHILWCSNDYHPPDITDVHEGITSVRVSEQDGFYALRCFASSHHLNSSALSRCSTTHLLLCSHRMAINTWVKIGQVILDAPVSCMVSLSFFEKRQF